MKENYIHCQKRRPNVKCLLYTTYIDIGEHYFLFSPSHSIYPCEEKVKYFSGDLSLDSGDPSEEIIL
jgi:hypothetical protein